MLTEAVKENIQIEKLKNGIELCEQAISKSEKYERLSDNTDWKGYLEDLRVLVGLHENEIKYAAMMMVDAPHNTYVKHDNISEVIVSSKLEWADFISRHQIQKQELENWLKEPERILELAKHAREKLPILKDQLTSLTKGGNNVEH